MLSNLLPMGALLLGGLGSSYFLGFLAGTYATPPLIRRIGHIRAVAFFTAAVAGTVLPHGLLAGVALYTIVESWLNGQAPPAHRGRIFAAYTALEMVPAAEAAHDAQAHQPPRP